MRTIFIRGSTTMTTQLLFYGNVNPVNRQKHKDLYVKTGADYSFAKEVNSVPLMAVEFPAAAAEYAIVFAGKDKEVLPAVIMGTTNNENLYLNEENEWQAKYIPAFIRRYPFVFAAAEDNKQLTLCIDENFSGCNTEGLGERLFDAEGENTQYLGGVLNFLEEYQAHFNRTKVFCEKLVELDLLEPMTAQFKVEGESKTLSGFMGINRDKIKALSGDQLSELAKTDGLELLYLHLQSLRNLNSMMEKAATGSEEEEKASEE